MSFQARIIWSLIRIISLLPFSIRSELGSWIGLLVWFFSSRDRRVGELQVKTFLPGHDAKKIIRSVYQNLGRNGLESLEICQSYSRGAFSVEYPDIDLIKQHDRSGRGAIILTGHMGNWDLLAGVAIQEGIELVATGKKANNHVMQEVLEKLRQSYGIDIVWRGEKNPMQTMGQHLKSGRVIAALIDQDTRVKNTMVNFFGKAVATPHTLVTWAVEHQVPIYCCFGYRTARSKFKIELFDLCDLNQPLEVLKRYNQLLEDQIRRHPGQWVWVHKRWRTLEDGSRLSTSEYLKFLEEGLSAQV